MPSSSRTQLKSRLLKLFAHSTVHGISHAASSNTRFERLFWLVLVFTGVAMFSANLIQVVHRYRRFPILTAYYASEEPFSWPCITFCDNTPVLLDNNATNDGYQSAVGNLTADPEVQSLAPLMDSFFENSLREESLNVLVRAIVLSTMDGGALGAENPKSIVSTVGYKLQTEQIQTEINMDSNWNLLQDADTLRFFHSSSVVMRYRCACHTLQLGDFVHRQRYRNIDSLQFFLRGNYLTYLRFNSSNYQFGGRLFIHQPGSLPEDGRQIETPPGVTTTVYLVQKRHRLLKRNDNCRDTEKTAMVYDYRMQNAKQYNLSYSYCHQIVSQRLFYEHCKCFNPHLIVPKLDSLPPVLCFNLSVYSKAEVAGNLQCLNKTAVFYRNESNFSPWLRKECGDLKRQRCDSIVWEMEKQRELYREMWTETANPARVNFIRDSIKSVTNDSNIPPETGPMLRRARLELSNFIMVASRERVEVVYEEPEYPLSQLLSDIGGLMGLYLGVSVVGLCELFEVLLLLLKNLLLKHQAGEIAATASSSSMAMVMPANGGSEATARSSVESPLVAIAPAAGSDKAPPPLQPPPPPPPVPAASCKRVDGSCHQPSMTRSKTLYSLDDAFLGGCEADGDEKDAV